MARSITLTSPVAATSGAFEIDKNMATVAGYASLAGGVVLAGAIGTVVAPVPTLGLTALGGGLIVAGNIEAVKEHFSDKTEYAPAEPELTGSARVAYEDRMATMSAEIQAEKAAAAA